MKLDALIIGGGIAGLWTLAELKRQGYEVILLEKSKLGGRQTLASQGIIHGGTKYALTGQLSGAAQAIAAMPARWQKAREGKEAVDLSDVKILSEHQYLWVNHGIASKLTAFFAGKVMQSRMERITGNRLPDFLPSHFQGHCYALAEAVFHIPDVLQAFANQFADFILTDCDWRREGEKFIAGEFEFLPDKIIFTAGENNLALGSAGGQLRPLQMAAVRVPTTAPDIFGHYLGVSDKPKITITTHLDQHGKIYYLGGQPAEEGIARSQEEQIAVLKKVLSEALPWVEEKQFQAWHTFFVHRAEGENGGKRPDLPTICQQGKEITVYPTKLAFAPWVADKIAHSLPPAKSYPPVKISGEVKIGQYPWLNLATEQENLS